MFRAGLTRVDGRKVARAALAPLACTWPAVRLVAVGKAALAMTQGALAILGDRVRAGLVVTKAGHGGSLPPGVPIRILEAGHPLPDATSLQAGAALLDFLAADPARTEEERGLFLLSGGASALVEALPDRVTLEDLRRVNGWLLGSGLDIHQMNRIRKRLSRIKGGRLAAHLAGRSATVLLLSDVPGDNPASIGSGPLLPELDTPLPEGLPTWLRELLDRVPPPPVPGDPMFARIDTRLIGSVGDALRAAGLRARCRGWHVRLAAGTLSGDAATQGAAVAAALLQGAPGVYLWGGETTVVLPPNPGRGGRNQHLALAAAQVIQGREDVIILAAGSDGSDADSPWAGAVVDGKTIARGQAAGHDPVQALARADAQAFLAASGGLLATGPTGTNVMDLVIGLKMALGR
ncbi:MAG: DUF4147 domain-containing protein [Magnetococcales bacterium]|nr:DUF4147 domain-containing protein [Magnetococcales bacterium]